MLYRIALVASTLVAPSSIACPVAGSCAAAPLAVVGSGSQTLVVAVGLPPLAAGILVAGPRAEAGPRFGSGRWCVADPRWRLATTCADADGTAVVRLEGRPHLHAGSTVQLVWRDRLSGQTGATGFARLAGG